MQSNPILRTVAVAGMATALILALGVAGSTAHAASGDPEAEPPTILASIATEEVTIILGTADDRLVATPKTLALEEGKYYRLVIKNPSRTTHFFWAPEFSANATWTDTASVDKGRVALKQTDNPGKKYVAWEFEVSPGGTAVWEFVPEKAGLYKWGCSNRVHEAAGMHGEIAVTAWWEYM